MIGKYSNFFQQYLSSHVHSEVKLNTLCFRCHQNDLENVPLFIFLAFFYVISGPNPFVAIMHFRIFAISRIIYSVVYLMAIPQPARAIAHWVGLFVNGSMAFQVMNYVLNNVKN